MAKKSILSLNMWVPSDDISQAGLESDQSLLDPDIILFRPGIPFSYPHEDYQGKPLLREKQSFQAQEAIRHWRSELKTAFEAGKTIFIFLNKPEDVYIYTGDKQYSGTGRNRVPTNFVTILNSYSSIPLDLEEVVSRNGQNIKSTQALGPLKAYWHEFGKDSYYECCLEKPIGTVCLVTQSGNKAVGAIVQGRHGLIVLLPSIEIDEDNYSDWDDERDEETLTKEGLEFGKRFLKTIVEVDKALRLERSGSPAPAWVDNPDYLLPEEARIYRQITNVSTKMEKLAKTRTELNTKLDQAGELKRLLYETGKPLETAIIEALTILGFEAESYDEQGSSFDVVFSSSEGRFLGEAEGTDKRAINIDKISQLERNLHEDFARDEIADFAKGVLFGNPERLTAPEKRANTFTEKCLQAAERIKAALILTKDLFQVVKYLKSSQDQSFARKCRKTILETEGSIVEFPVPPKLKKRIKKT